MFRRLVSAAIAALVVLSVLAACAPSGETSAAQDVKLYQVLPVARKSGLVHAPGEGEMIALVNTGAKAHTISGWKVETLEGGAELPRLTLKPGQAVYLADGVEYFRKNWNFAPDFEYGADTDKAVPDLKLEGSNPPGLGDQGDVVRLLDENGRPADILIYGITPNSPSPWSGPAVQFVSSFPLTPANQVLTRLHDGSRFQTASKAAAWSGGTPTDPERVWFAGQSDFPVRSVTGNFTLTAAAAPDNAGQLLFGLADGAKSSIRLVGYQYTSEELTDHLIAAVKRGVKVQVAIDRNPSGADMYESDKEIQKKLHQGGVDILYYYKWDGDLSTRVNPLHNKYGIFDDQTVLIASGNFTNSVYNSDPSCGNREWIASLSGSPDLVKLFREVWDFDIGSGHPEVRSYDEKKDAPLKPDDYDPGPCVKYTPVKPKIQSFTGRATVTRILSPDNTMDREQGFLGLLRGARSELLISANYINKWWGAAGDSSNFTKYPQPYLTEIVAAARRGVSVKVVLDRRSVRADSLRDNQYVVQYLNDLAARENLKLAARLVNVDATGIGRTYHNKSLIVDGDVVISSVNGSENSFRYAREMAIRIGGVPGFTQFYRDLFNYDWEKSARPNMPWNLLAFPRAQGSYLDWSANAELEVTGYEVFYKPQPGAAWSLLGRVDRPGYEDGVHEHGTWGVVAVTKQGTRSDYAQVER